MRVSDSYRKQVPTRKAYLAREAYSALRWYASLLSLSTKEQLYEIKNTETGAMIDPVIKCSLGIRYPTQSSGSLESQRLPNVSLGREARGHHSGE